MTEELVVRSNANGKEQMIRVIGTEREVPSYYALPGYSVADAAKSLGGRVLSRREPTTNVFAEVHETGGPSYWVTRDDDGGPDGYP